MRALRAGLAALALAGAALAGGCGEADPPREPRKAATQAPAVTLPPTRAELRIDSPRDRQRLESRRIRPGGHGAVQRHAVVRVRGRGAPGETVVVAGFCAVRGCLAQTTIGASGRWAATVEVAADDEDPRASIGVHYARPGRTEEPAEVRVTLVVEREPASRPAKRAPRRPARAPARRTGSLVLVGDSLTEGAEPHVPGSLPGWRTQVDGRRNRTLAEGMEIVRALRARPDVLAVALFTNDDPGNLEALESAVRESLTRAPCVVWSTIARPPVGGRGYDDANGLLRALASRQRSLRIADWAGLVRRRPDLLTGDGVHATASGYQARAQQLADAARDCLG